MAAKYDWVGTATTQLPFIHDSFPASPKLGTVRYYTMRSMYRGRDAERKRALSLQRPLGNELKPDNKEIADVKLPKLNLDTCNGSPRERKNTDQISAPSGNISKQKAYFRLKGIDYEQLYSVNRNKADKDERQQQRYRQKTVQKSCSSVSLRLNSPVMEKEKSSSVRSDPETYRIGYEAELGSKFIRRLHELDGESPIPGFKHRRSHYGRKLGNIVSSRRMQQLLDNSDPLNPYKFYA